MALRIFVLLSCFLFLAPGAQAFQGYVRTQGNATIAWGDGSLSVAEPLEVAEDAFDPDHASAIAVRKAATSARKQLLDTILGIRIDARSTIGAYLADNDELAAALRGLVQNSPLERPSALEGPAEVRVSESLRGELAQYVLPTTMPFQSNIPPRLSTSLEQQFMEDAVEPAPAGYLPGGYTGLVVDARGLNVTPALAPVIYGQDGEGVYGAFLVSRDAAVRHGIAAYADTVEPGALVERVGDRPLMVKALSAFGSWRTDLVVATPMAHMIKGLMRPGPVVETCRVVIVLDAPAAPLEETEESGEGME